MNEHACRYERSLSWHSLCVQWYSHHSQTLHQNIGCLGSYFKQNLKTVDEPCDLVDELILHPVSKQPIVYFLRIKPVKISSYSIIHNLTIGFIGNTGIFTNIRTANGEILVSDTTDFSEVEVYLESLKPIDLLQQQQQPIAINVVDDQQLIPALDNPVRFTSLKTPEYEFDKYDKGYIQMVDCSTAKSCRPWDRTKSTFRKRTIEPAFDPVAEQATFKRRRNKRRTYSEFAIRSRTFGASDGHTRVDAQGQIERNSYTFVMQMRTLRHDSMPYD